MSDLLAAEAGGVRERYRAGTAQLLLPLVAATLAVCVGVLRLQGTDVPAQLYRVGLFHRQGLTLWDSQWYGGHFTLDYSVIFPPIAGVLGLYPTAAISSAAAAVSFDRLVISHFGSRARVGSAVFAISTLVQVSIGQLPFLLGEALALAALATASRRRWRAAVVLALAASLASPLAGGFLGLAALAWLVMSWPRDRAAIASIIAAAAAPLLVMAAAFPGQGAMPFPAADFAAEGAVFAVLAVITPRGHHSVRVGALVYLAAFGLSFLVRSPIGGNIERLGETFGLPLALCVLWPLRRAISVVLIIALAAIDWGPAVTTLSAGRDNPSSHPAYFAPMLAYVTAHDNPPGRVEVVPTALHWEVADAAPRIPLARGWERQLDTADNPIFYTKGALTPASYRSWLVDNGVRFVALPDVQLDYAAIGEAALVRAGVPGLPLVWRTAHWSIFAVQGGPGIVSGPARPTVLNGAEILLQVATPGTVVVRERYSPLWSVTRGVGCIAEAAGGWLAIRALRPGPLRAELRLVGPRTDPC